MDKRLLAGVAFAVLAVLLLAGCIRSEPAFFAETPRATPLPDSLVMVPEDDRAEALLFRRQGDDYVSREDDRTTRYALIAMPAVGGRDFFIAMETSDRDPGAYYGLVETEGSTIILYDVDAGAIAGELGIVVENEDGATRFDAQGDLRAVFERAAADAVSGSLRSSRFEWFDMADPVRRVEGERLLEETRKAGEGD